MKFRQVAIAGLVTGLFLGIDQPRAEAVACRDGTVGNHPNGSLAHCILPANTLVELNRSPYPCLGGQYIYFTEKGTFRSCILSQELTVRNLANGRTMRCPANNWVSVKVEENGSQTIICDASHIK